MSLGYHVGDRRGLCSCFGFLLQRNLLSYRLCNRFVESKQKLIQKFKRMINIPNEKILEIGSKNSDSSITKISSKNNRIVLNFVLSRYEIIFEKTKDN